jgi:ribonuclease D
MADPGREKVLHGGEYDLSLLKRDYGFEFAGVFDTQLAARFCGIAEPGLQALLERELGVGHSKSRAVQRSDWSRRPLTEAQLRYAAEDVRHLLELRDRLLERLRSLGREDWVREECEAMSRAPGGVHREPADARRAKGARDLEPRQRAVLRELFRLREEWAREADLPLFKVAGDEALVRLALRPPPDEQALRRFPGLSWHIRERRARQVLEAIRRGDSAPEEPPEPPPPFRPRPPREAFRRMDRLKAWRARAAERLGLDPGLLLPQRLIDRLALDAPETPEALAAVPGLRQWRAKTFGPELLQALRP